MIMMRLLIYHIGDLRSPLIEEPLQGVVASPRRLRADKT